MNWFDLIFVLLGGGEYNPHRDAAAADSLWSPVGLFVLIVLVVVIVLYCVTGHR